MRVTIASLISPSRPGLVGEVAAQVSAEEAQYLWLRDAAGPVVFEVPPAPVPAGLVNADGAVRIGGHEAVDLLRLLLSFAGPETVRRFERALARAARLGRGRLPALVERLEGAVTRYLQADKSGVLGLEEVADLLQAWSAVVIHVEGKEALYRIYEGRVKPGKAELVQEAQRAEARRSLREAVKRLARFIRLAKAILRRCRRERLPLQEAYRVIPQPVVKPAPAPKPEPTTKPAPTTEQAEPAPKKVRVKKSSRVAELREKLQKRLAEKRLREARKAAAERHRMRKAAVRAALRRKKARALLKVQGVNAPALHAALVEAVKWGALRNRDVAQKVLTALRGREHNMAAIAAAIDALALHDIVWRLYASMDCGGDFAAVVSSASDGGRDAERRLLAALEARGVEVVTSQKADRQAGVDAIVTIGGVRVALQLTTMPWWAATTPTEASAMKRLVNGQVEVGPAVSKVQKDLEKFRKHYGDLPYVIAGVNVRMPFTPEQYADDVLRLLERQASYGGARVAFIAAPGLVAYEEEVR